MTDTDNKSKKKASGTSPAEEASTANSSTDVDTLLQSLVFLTSYYGQAKSSSAIRAGLAYDERGMRPNLFVEAAHRLGMKAQIVKRPQISAIPEGVLPVVIMAADGKASVLLSYTDKDAEIFDPKGDTKQTVSMEGLEKTYAGFAIFVQPRPEFTDSDAKPVEGEYGRHWFWGAVLENRALYGRVILGALLVNIFALTSPIFIMNVYDRVIPNNALATGWVLAIGALTVFIFDFVIRTLRGYFIDLAGRRIDVAVTRRIYDQLLDMKLSGKPVSGGAFANMLREFETVRDFLTSATMTAVVDLPFTLFFLGIIYIIGGPIAFLLAGLIVFVIGVGLLLQWPLKVMVKKSVISAEAKHGLLVETITGLETIKAVNAEGRMRARYGAYVGESARQSQSSRFVSGLGVNFAAFLQQSATVLIVLIGMYLIRDAELSMGGLIATVILAGRAIAPIGQVANLMARYYQARSAMKTLNDIMALPTERPAGKRFVHRPDLQGKIAFERVSFAYPNTDRQVLTDVSFTIQAGENVGIIGRVGSGKSTIARLLMGLYEPIDGVIYADDTDYRQIDPADLRRNMAYIPQDVVLFRGTVRENIAMGNPHATEEEILNAAKSAGVHDFICRHPLGYDAPVGERGEGLSGGQRQSIALARAMLLNPNVLICDEPTNAMDVEAEKSFTSHIAEQAKDKTLVLITHRHHLLTLVDRLILLDQGRAIIDGPRDKVIAALNSGKIRVPDPQGSATVSVAEKETKATPAKKGNKS